MKCPGSGKSTQTLNLSNLIATCKKLLHFANCAYLKLGCAAGKHYIASMANGVKQMNFHGWSYDRGLWKTAWRGIASRKRIRDRYPGIAYS
jgi:adenylate kinase family enzyme